MIIHTDHRPLQFIQTQGKLQNDRHQKWSTYLEQFHLNIKYKKGSTNNVAGCLSQPPIMAITTMLNSCGNETSDWPLLYKSNPEFSIRAIQNSTTHTRHSQRETKFQNFTSRMYYYVTWDTFVFFKRACQDDLGSALQSGRWVFWGRENSAILQKYFYWPNL